ncbi:hypothetical protein RHSIM_Rhsim11G0043300 [Rhododendron simsii]|uniref:ADP/ATP translocase n=1 Tax=Rhododendron simsii TaxID=118357 RepID=A0A834LAP9_RHOSS|nr:hypothetical protein RHSIM_Rhsim11G0043300 [Rhododendron simsii]
MVEEEGEEGEDSSSESGLRRRSSGPYDWVTSFQRDLMAGAVMGGLVHTIVAPIERAKLLLQTQESNAAIVSGPHRRFKGMVDCIVRTVREEGILSLWRGNGSSVLRYYPSVALNFSLKDDYNSRLPARSSKFNFLLITSMNFFCSWSHPCNTLFVVCPVDHSNQTLAWSRGRSTLYKFRKKYYFGRTSILKIIPYGIVFGAPPSAHFMTLRTVLLFKLFSNCLIMISHKNKPELALWKRWVVAQAVTTSAGLVSYPLDTVRRRMMMQSGLEHAMYGSTMDCWKKIYRTEGVASFYRGALSNVFRSTGAAAILVLYDEVKKFMNWGRL